MKRVRIGAGMGFYGDSVLPAVETARKGRVQYIAMDDLAELTLAILQKDRRKDPNLGYTQDITQTMQLLLPEAVPRGIRLITNAGGINPPGAAREVLRVAKELGLDRLRAAVVTGDAIGGRLEELEAAGVCFEDPDTGRTLDQVRDRILFASVYLGSDPIVRALAMGADVVVTGRTTDTAQFAAPVIHELGWAAEEWDRIAAAILLGHLMECSGQATGGNFSGRWWEVEGLEAIGYPVAEVDEEGGILFTKTEGTGGLVTVDTVKEQLLYEIHDPSRYLTPDVTADFSQVRLEQVGPDQVRVSGVRGRPAPPTLKALVGYEAGWAGEGMMGFSWPDALAKARRAEEIVRRQMERQGIEAEEVHASFVGFNALHGPMAPEPDPDSLNEVFLRMAIRTGRQEDAARFARLFPPLALNGPPFIGGLGGVARPRQLQGYLTGYVPRELIEPHVQVELLEVGS
ncbi:acyclic terpene utilization AtuA family protein [Limnochorda pilosa]|uniref:Acyclic terpene utilisation N-terminal domain-containing protein n=1 Tax=Limnochorda pilosa TaxID=1555112 RepID=A0A0K2SPG7_LIMPI|nr:acyclic terpene utilization AtuA family protein [Limnochorda pilosa]BAS29033.1 hypothetical protein LIP_3216 [Limnochorda pilosa]